MLALAGAVLAEAGLPASARARLTQIVELAEWQADVVEQVLRAAAGEVPGAGQADLVLAVTEAVAAERVTWTGELTLVWAPEPARVPLQAVTVRRMAANLLANAMRAAGPDGTVTIEVSRRENWTLLTVEDSGPGFGRLPGGSGLGLSAVAREAIKHRGRVECGRGRLGGGRVSLWLPALPSGVGGRAADAACAV